MLMTAKDDATCVEREKFAEAFSPDKPIASPDSGLLSTLCCVRLETPETWQLRSVETWRHGDMETWRHGDMETSRLGDWSGCGNGLWLRGPQGICTPTISPHRMVPKNINLRDSNTGTATYQVINMI
jgi:hypothetical protein